MGTNTYIWTSNINIWKNELFDLIMQDHLSTKVLSLQNYSLWQFSTLVKEDQKHAFHKTKLDSLDWVFFQNLCVILGQLWGMRIFL